MSFLRMNELDLTNKRVLIREDLNVPLAVGEVSNDTRIRAALPTLIRALETASQVIVMSHLGRPSEGVAVAEQQEFSLAPVARHLGQLLDREIPRSPAISKTRRLSAQSAWSCWRTCASIRVKSRMTQSWPGVRKAL